MQKILPLSYLALALASTPSAPPLAPPSEPPSTPPPCGQMTSPRALHHPGPLPAETAPIRRPSSAYLDDLLEAAPDLVWLQLGIRHDPTAQQLEQRSIQVVQDRCLKVDHARVFGF